ncbi:hypothetical protein EDF64_10281 [Curtobacterium flaccumfaciens]|uniref:Uncharacterized protein n=1 Tax=Curtobacterium flaccumfaciens TaxID=2035 RepID=A0A4V3BLC6_9MICO|nr:hypothetical protein [Curtobacterium flaccumfaciens]TDN45672.1 hypothetical protein EDF64_10281 [Curtobacterium flaccumfaciens]
MTRWSAHRRDVVPVIVLTLLFGVLLTTWAYVTPALHGPDELANVDAAIQLAMGRSWPAAGDLHYLQGLLAQNVPQQLVPVTGRGSFADVVGDGSVNTLVNPMSQHPPTYFLAQAVVAHVLDFTTRRWDIVVLGMRLVDVLVMLPLPALVWATVRRVTRSPRTALAATVALFAVPQIAQLGSSVSVWVPVITAGATATWLGVRILTGDRSWWTVLALGGTLAIATAVMAGGFMLVPFAIVVVLAGRTVSAHTTAGLTTSGHTTAGHTAAGLAASGNATSGHAVDGIGRRVLRAVVVVAVPAVTTGWWYLRQFVRTGTPQPDAFPAVTQPWPRYESPAPTQFAGAFWDGLSNSFWGRLGRYEWPLSPIIVDVFTVVALTVVVWAATRRVAARRTMLLVAVLPATALVVVLVRDWATYAGHLGVTVNQGRFLFPSIAALLLLQALAWATLVVSPVARVRLARTALVVAPLMVVASLGLLYSGAFQNTVFGVLRSGVGALSTSVAYGLKGVAVLLVLLAVVGVVAFVLLWRAFAAPAPEPADATAAPAPEPADATAATAPGGPDEGDPLNSPPTVEPTQRNIP